MSIFEEVKQSVTTRQAAERYGVRVGRETSLQKQNHVDYLLDTLLSPDMEERAALIASYGKEVRTIERRMAELEAGTAAGRDGRHTRSAAAPER